MGTDTLAGAAFKPYKNNFGGIDVPRVVEKLFYQLASTFADTHVSERAIAGM